MNRQSFLKRMLAIIPGVIVAKDLLTQPVKEISIDPNVKPDYVASSGQCSLGYGKIKAVYLYETPTVAVERKNGRKSLKNFKKHGKKR